MNRKSRLKEKNGLGQTSTLFRLFFFFFFPTSPHATPTFLLLYFLYLQGISTSLRRGGHRRGPVIVASSRERALELLGFVEHDQVPSMLLPLLLSFSFLLVLAKVIVVVVVFFFLSRPQRGLLQLELPRVVLVETSLLLF